jgi:hypothetical protein
MRALPPFLIAALLVACAPGSPLEPPPARTPAPLDHLVLAEDLPDMTPVPFAHSHHLDAAVVGREVACADCHHTLKEHLDRIPTRCSECHAPEREPHDETDPPDL